MNIFGIGLPEMAVILVIALLVFGPKKLPEIGRSFGKAIRGFQEASKEFESEFKREASQLEDSVKMKAELEGSQKKEEV
jgi:sec-independent protein translocase protein TatA